MRFVDLTGKHFGKWTVLQQVANKNTRTRWRCRCECGNQKVVYGQSLVRGASRSCGCERVQEMTQDLTGQKFGRLTVKRMDRRRPGESGIRWICVCDCGKTIRCRAGELRRAGSQSCGCSRQGYDLVGQRFGRLVVLRRARHRKNWREWHWRCACDCGAKVIITGSKLRSGHTRSCGCLATEKSRDALVRFMGGRLATANGKPGVMTGAASTGGPSKHAVDPGHPVKVMNFTDLAKLLLPERVEEKLPENGNLALDLDDFNDTERNILEALDNKVMTGEQLLKRAGYEYSGYYRGVLSSLRKRDALGQITEGYFRPDKRPDLLATRQV